MEINILSSSSAKAKSGAHPNKGEDIQIEDFKSMLNAKILKNKPEVALSASVASLKTTETESSADLVESQNTATPPDDLAIETKVSPEAKGLVIAEAATGKTIPAAKPQEYKVVVDAKPDNGKRTDAPSEKPAVRKEGDREELHAEAVLDTKEDVSHAPVTAHDAKATEKQLAQPQKDAVLSDQYASPVEGMLNLVLPIQITSAFRGKDYPMPETSKSIHFPVRESAKHEAKSFGEPAHPGLHLGADNEVSNIMPQTRAESVRQNFSDVMKQVERTAEPAAQTASLPATLSQIQSTVTQNPVVTHHIQPPFGSKEWGASVSQRIVMMLGANEQTATLTLSPPDLGPLQVVLSVKNDHADAAFMAQSPEVRQAIEGNMSTLRTMMENAGVTLGETSVGQHKDGQREPQQQQQQGNRSGFDTQAKDELPTDASPVVKTYAADGLIDTFA